MTPLHIKIMLHHSISSERYSLHDSAHASSEAVRDYHDELVMLGMLDKVGTTVYHQSGYKVTKKGEFYINYLLSIPVPSTKYVIEFDLPF